MVSENRTEAVLKGSERSPNSDIKYTRKLINFEIIESIKHRGNVDDPFGLKRLFSCINNPDQFLA